MVNNTAKLKIRPSTGEAYDVEIPIPDYIYYEKEYVDAWIDDHLKRVEGYEIICFTTYCAKG